MYMYTILIFYNYVIKNYVHITVVTREFYNSQQIKEIRIKLGTLKLRQLF